MRIGITLVLLLILSTTVQAQHIVIDPGHGGVKPGGSGNGMVEKDIVLDISQRFFDLLEADTADTAGGGTWTVSMTRSADVDISLAARASFANSMGADRFMSIHSNAFADPQANGTETFSVSETGNGALLRELVQEEVIAAWGLRNRGNKTANFSVLVNTAMPAELHELGFVTNTTDAAKLASTEDRQLAAQAHLRAIQRHYGIEPYIPETTITEVGHLELLVSSAEGPVSGASLKVDGTAHSTRSDDNGKILVKDLAPGEHLFVASASGYKDTEATIAIVADEVGTQTILLENAVNPECDPALTDCEPDIDDEGGCGCSSGGGGNSSALLFFVLILIAIGKPKRHSSEHKNASIL